MAKYKESDKPVRPRARNDAYVMMLFITFLAIVAGTVLVYLDHDQYGGKPPTAPPPVQTSSDAGAPAPTPGAAKPEGKTGG